MKTLPISEYQNHPELWKFSVIVENDIANIYEDGDVLPPEFQADYVAPPELTLDDVIALLTDKGVIAVEDIATAKQAKVDAIKAASEIASGGAVKATSEITSSGAVKVGP